MRRWLNIIFVIGLLLALCGCVAEIRPDGYGGHRYYRYYYYDYGYPHEYGFYYRYRNW